MAKGQAEAALTADEMAAALISAILDPENRPIINAIARGTLEFNFGHGDEITMRVTTHIRRRLTAPSSRPS